ncbi:hypothetical protein VE00_02822 [Pseudogymnoascus sp. WSF 3629]|nr:hypothetical protein VE00_02822 [Pseudogymnoascus sp. WSF 3629]
MTPPPPPLPLYNQSTLTPLLTHHYTTLSQICYITPSSILLPPPTDWPSTRLSTPSLRLIGRNETVISLLQHIPYLDKEYQVWPETEHLKYLDWKWDDADTITKRMAQERGGGGDIYPFSPFSSPLASMVTLTHEWGGVWWVIDTDTGLVWPSESQWSVHTGEGEMEWMWYVPVGIEAFFDNVWRRLVGLEVVPMRGFGRERKGGEEEEGVAVKKIFLKCGWPDLSNFRREECIKLAGEARLRVVEGWEVRWLEGDIKEAEERGDGEDRERLVERGEVVRREFAREWVRGVRRGG